MLISRVLGQAARIQSRLSSRSARYRSFAFRAARLLGYAISGDNRFRQLSLELGPGPPIEAGATVSAVSAHSLPPVSTDHDPLPQKRIQLFRQMGVGDVLLITTILEELRRKDPRAHIAIITRYPEILEGNPNVDELIKAEAPRPGYDVTLEMQYELTPDDHIVDVYARVAGVSVSHRTPQIFLSEDDLRRADAVLQAAGVDLARPICGLHMDSGWKVRDWPVRHFAEVAAALKADGVQVLLLGEKAEEPLPFGIDLRGKTTVREAAGVIFKSSALLAVDSSLMHIGLALRRPVVSLFGCTNPEKRLPDWALKHAFYSDIVCRGCHHRQRPVPVITAPICPFETVRCMEGLAPEPVIASLRQVLTEQSRPKVSIVIPHYNDVQMTSRCLQSVFRNGAKAGFEVIVVDDSSNDLGTASLSAWSPRIQVHRNARNLGFAASCNAGAGLARGELLVFLNNDTEVTPDWLDALVKAIEADPQAGVVGPKLLYPQSNLIQHCGTAINERGVGEHLYRLLPSDFAAANRPRAYRALTGACMMVRREEFLALGGFDPVFRMGGEDTDLCFKYLDRGKHCLYWPQSVVYHHEGYSRGRRDLGHEDDVFNRKVLSDRWAKYLVADVSDYCLLGEIEAAEKRTWLQLCDVPVELRNKYDSEEARQVGSYPFRCEIGSGMNPTPGYIHLEIMPDAPSLDIRHDIANPLPFLSGTVRVLLANHVIEHVSWRSLPALVGEICRVLVPGGRALIRTPNLRYVAKKFVRGKTTPEHPDDEKAIEQLYGRMTPGLWANLKLFSGQDYSSNFHFLCMDPQDLADLFRRAGFRKVELVPFGREFSPGEIQLVAEK